MAEAPIDYLSSEPNNTNGIPLDVLNAVGGGGGGGVSTIFVPPSYTQSDISKPLIVNLVSKTDFFENIIKNYKINDIVTAKFYITSNKKNDRYYTTATLLELQKNNL